MFAIYDHYRVFVWKKKTSQQSENALPANIMVLLFPLWNNFKSKVFYVILFLFHTLQLSTSQIIMPLIVRRALLKIFMRLFWVFMLICIVHILCRGNVSPKTSLELSWALYFSSSIKKKHSNRIKCVKIIQYITTWSNINKGSN